MNEKNTTNPVTEKIEGLASELRFAYLRSRIACSDQYIPWSLWRDEADKNDWRSAALHALNLMSRDAAIVAVNGCPVEEVLAERILPEEPTVTPLQMLTAQIAATLYERKSSLVHGTLLNQHDIILGAVKEAAELARTILDEVKD